jgi:hypothetical protein
MWSPFTTVDEDLTDHIRSAIASLPDAPVGRDLERPYAARESDTRPVLLEPLPAGFRFGRRRAAARVAATEGYVRRRDALA